jgi:hypothetical protein
MSIMPFSFLSFFYFLFYFFFTFFLALIFSVVPSRPLRESSSTARQSSPVHIHQLHGGPRPRRLPPVSTFHLLLRLHHVACRSSPRRAVPPRPPPRRSSSASTARRRTPTFLAGVLLRHARTGRLQPRSAPTSSSTPPTTPPPPPAPRALHAAVHLRRAGHLPCRPQRRSRAEALVSGGGHGIFARERWGQSGNHGSAVCSFG